MSSGFPGAVPNFFADDRRAAAVPVNVNNNGFHPQQHVSFRSTVSAINPEHASEIAARRIGKRSHAEFQQQALGFYLRNVKPRTIFQISSPIVSLSQADFPAVTAPSPEVSSISSSLINYNINRRYGFPILQEQQTPQSLIFSNGNAVNYFSASVNRVQESEKKMLQELEKQLLDDEEDEGEAASVVTSSELSETIQNLISPSPTSSSSSCSSTSASPPLPCLKQSLIDAAVALSEGNSEAATEIFTRLQPAPNAKGNSEQRLAAYMVSAFKSRVNPTADPPPVSELYGREQLVATQMLYEVSPCFKLGFMAANLAVLEVTSEQGFHKIHVVDFDIGQGGQYVHLLHALTAKKREGKSFSSLKITTLADPTAAAESGGEENLKAVGEGLKALANKLGVRFAICQKISNFNDLSREQLGVLPDEALAVNFAFQLFKLPDESVTTENLRDELLRRVRGWSPSVMTVVEQEMNANTAPLAARVREVCDHYGALLDSLDATVSRENSDRVRIEEGLCRKMKNSVACEGRDRVERCEVFGKWRARVGMAGFKIRPMSVLTSESLRSKLNSATRGNPGFTIADQAGGICFGWMGRTLTVASAWG